MLVEIRIENLGVIESLHLTFKHGFTAFTGETGAGKTMLIEAISLLIGGRADATVVRTGASEARVEGRFITGTHGEEIETVLARVVPTDGRSRAYVNGRMATVAALSEVGSDLVDIHGQHDHQRLLGSVAQRSALDAFGGIDTSGLRAARDRVTEIEAAIASLGGDERTRAREVDLLRYQCEEIRAAHLSDPDEDQALRLEQERLSDITTYREALSMAVEELQGEDGVIDRLGAVRSRVSQTRNLDDIANRLNSVIAEVSEASRDLGAMLEGAGENPERLEEVLARRQLLRDVMRKYGSTLQEVMDFADISQRRLSELEGYEERIRELSIENQVALAHLAEVASDVFELRRSAAPKLAKQVESRLRGLAMDHASVAVEIVPTGDEVDAGEHVVFMLSANPGSPLMPLHKVASGGELARTMLALRLSLTEEPGTMVFDEVDAGIGGEAALAVARALAELGERHQIFVVTHLPQVAAAAAHHIGVRKTVDSGATFGTAETLDEASRVVEVARMLSGGIADEAARQHAEEMLRTFSPSPRTN